MTEQERIESIKKNGGRHLQNFKEENITYEMCLVAVKRDGAALLFVPEKFRTKEIYLEACKTWGRALSIVPETFYSNEIFTNAVKADGLALQFVPIESRSKEICLWAILDNAKAYAFVPVERITPEFVTSVAENNYYESISNLPKQFKNHDFYYELICLDPEFIWYIPRNALSAKIGKAYIEKMGFDSAADAVKARPELLSRLHKTLYDHDSCLNFVQSDYFNDSWIPDYTQLPPCGFNTDADEEKGRLYLHNNFTETFSLPDIMKWPDVSIYILKHRGDYIKYAAPEIINEEMCKVAVATTYYALEDIPERFRTKEICMIAFEKSPFSIQYFPIEYITEDLVIRAVKHSGFALGDIPEEFRTKEACLIAVSDNGHVHIKDVPSNIIDKEICLTWLKNADFEVFPLDNIPDAIKDNDIYLAAVALYGEDLKNVPPENITQEMCDIAVKRSYRAFEYVPERFVTDDLLTVVFSSGAGSPWFLSDITHKRFPKEYWTKERVERIVQKAPNAANYLMRFVE